MSRGLRVVAAAVALLAGACAQPPPAEDPQAAPVQAAVTPQAAETADLGEARRAARRVTVKVRTFCGDTPVGAGSGFVAEERLVVTNRHVAELAEELRTSGSGDAHAHFAAVSLYSDLALVTTEERLPQSARLARHDPEPGEQVVVAGHPNGGVLRALPGEIVSYEPAKSYGWGNVGNIVLLDAEVAPGSSGGPVFNADGEVVAVVYAIDTGSGFGMAIPVSTLRTLMEQVRQDRHWMIESSC